MLLPKARLAQPHKPIHLPKLPPDPKPSHRVIASATTYDSKSLGTRPRRRIIVKDGLMYFVLDSGATMHMVPFRTCFTKYAPVKNRVVRLADTTLLPIHGIGTITIEAQGKTISIHHVLHVPDLSEALFSCVQHQKFKGCSFHLENDMSTLAFPTFAISAPVSQEGKLWFHPCSNPSALSFDSSTSPTVASYKAAMAATAAVHATGSKIARLATLGLTPLGYARPAQAHPAQTLPPSVTQDPSVSPPLPPPFPPRPTPVPTSPPNIPLPVPPDISQLLTSIRPTPTDQVPSSAPGVRRLTPDELRMCIGYRNVSDYIRVIPRIASPTVKIVNVIDPTPQLGDVATI